MKKQETVWITPADFRKYLPSQAIRMVIEDVKKIHAKGVHIDMDTWVDDTEFSEEGETKMPLFRCSVCLGGAAIMSFNDYIPDSDFYDKMAANTDGDRISNAFNYLRMGSYSSFYQVFRGKRIPNALHNSLLKLPVLKFDGYVESSELEEMYTHLELVALTFEKAGY